MSELIISLDCYQFPPLKGFSPEQTFTCVQRVAVTRIIRGMQSGKSSVAVTAFDAEGKPAIIEMSMAHFLAAADAFRAEEQQMEVQKN